MIANAELTLESQTKTDLSLNNRKLNDQLTNTGITVPGAVTPDVVVIPDLTIIGGNITLSNSRIVVVQAIFDDLKNQILTLQLAIINA